MDERDTQPQEARLRTVRLLNPSICAGCRFSQPGSAEFVDITGRIKPAYRCLRLDCDNWDTTDDGSRPAPGSI